MKRLSRLARSVTLVERSEALVERELARVRRVTATALDTVAGKAEEYAATEREASICGEFPSALVSGTASPVQSPSHRRARMNTASRPPEIKRKEEA